MDTQTRHRNRAPDLLAELRRLDELVPLMRCDDEVSLVASLSAMVAGRPAAIPASEPEASRSLPG